MPEPLTCAICKCEAWPTWNEWTVCSVCATILIRDGQTLRTPTLYEWQEIICDFEAIQELKGTQYAVVFRNEWQKHISRALQIAATLNPTQTE